MSKIEILDALARIGRLNQAAFMATQTLDDETERDPLATLLDLIGRQLEALAAKIEAQS